VLIAYFITVNLGGWGPTKMYKIVPAAPTVTPD